MTSNLSSVSSSRIPLLPDGQRSPVANRDNPLSPVETKISSQQTHFSKFFNFFNSINQSRLQKSLYSFAFGSAYWVIGVAGMDSIGNLFPKESGGVKAFLYSLTAVSCMSHVVIYYKISTNFTPVPFTLTSAGYFFLSALPALPFGLAGFEGSNSLGLSKPLVYSLAGFLYYTRVRWIFDGMIKSDNVDEQSFPNPAFELAQKCMPTYFSNKDIVNETTRLEKINSKQLSQCTITSINIWVIVASFFLSACDTDPIHLGITKIGTSLGAEYSDELYWVAFSGAIIGAAVTFSSGLCWGKKILEDMLKSDVRSLTKAKAFALAIAILWTAGDLVGPIGVVSSESTLKEGPMLSQLFGTKTWTQQTINELYRITWLCVVLVPIMTTFQFEIILDLFNSFKNRFHNKYQAQEIDNSLSVIDNVVGSQFDEEAQIGENAQQ